MGALSATQDDDDEHENADQLFGGAGTSSWQDNWIKLTFYLGHHSDQGNDANMIFSGEFVLKSHTNSITNT